MRSLRFIGCLRIYSIYGLFILPYVKTDWPSNNSSGPQLLGLFHDTTNVTDSNTWFIHARAMFKAAVVLSRRYNITLQGDLIGWQTVDAVGDAMDSLAGTCQQISNSSIVGIVGPAFSQEAHFIASFAKTIGLPAISYSATDPALADRGAYPTFYRTVPSDNTGALAIAQLFVQFNWASAAVIYQNDAYGTGGAKAIDETFNQLDLVVTQMIIFDLAKLAIRGNLRSLLMDSSTRIVVVWVDLAYMSAVLDEALRGDVLGPHFVWILSSDVSLDTYNSTSLDKLSGMLTVSPVVGSSAGAAVNTALLAAAYDIWEQHELETFPGSDKVDNYALFAFDATWTLIRALADLCSAAPCSSFNGDSFCFNRRFANSSALIDIIDHTSFRGITGAVQFNRSTTDRLDGNYYIARNVRRSSNSLYYAPVLVWSSSSGWTRNAQTDTIIWPGNTLTAPVGYAVISGTTMRVALIESPPFTMKVSVGNGLGGTSTKLVGYVLDLMEELKSQMHFTPNITLFPPEQSYNGLIDMVANGTFDLLIGDVTVTAKRREKVGFSSATFDNSLRIIVRETQGKQLEVWAYLKPFSSKLWLTVFGAIIYAGLLMCILERQSNEALRSRSLLSLLAMGIWYSCATVIGSGADFQATTATGRLLTLGMYILSLILVAAYTANLASDLTLSKSAGAINGLEDLKNGKIPSNRIGIVVSSSIEDYYLREVSSGNPNYFPLRSTSEIYSSLMNNLIDAAIWDSGTLEYAVGSIYCNLTLVGADFDRSAFAVVSPKNWKYQPDLDVAVLSIRESGTFEELKLKWFQSSTCSSSSTEVATAMPVESMVGLFMTFGVISVLSLLWFIWIKRRAIKNCLFVCVRRTDSSEPSNDSSRPNTDLSTSKDSSPHRPSIHSLGYF